jgi:NAD(P)-dependent dehydrogenase (short-subunit alcohol dehydrogenase family)
MAIADVGGEKLQEALAGIVTGGGAWLYRIARSEWVVYAKPPFGGPHQVLKYLARYTHRVAIANQRLIALQDGHVSFRWKDYTHARAAEVDALDELAVDNHLQSVIDKVGCVDISFNAIGIRDKEILGVPLTEMNAGQFSLPITTYTTSYFLTARLAARHMTLNKSGVIMTATALPSRKGTPLNGGYGPAQAAKEAMTRDLSYELAPQGIRVVGLRPHGILETSTMTEVFDIRAKASGITWEQFQQRLASDTHARRVMTLEEMANVAVFMASDKASGMTGTTVNLTMGSLDD